MLRRWTLALVLLSTGARSAWGSQTELEECLDAGTFCSESDPILMDESCGQEFYRFHGRIVWPPLLNVGPVTISVRTRSLELRTAYPLYLEIRGRSEHEPPGCVTYIDAYLLLVGQGADQCGGVWETFGPVDLSTFGVPLGTMYYLQAVFFEDLAPPDHQGFYSVGLSCIRVTSQPEAVTGTSWSLIKSMYR